MGQGKRRVKIGEKKFERGERRKKKSDGTKMGGLGVKGNGGTTGRNHMGGVGGGGGGVSKWKAYAGKLCLGEFFAHFGAVGKELQKIKKRRRRKKIYE